MQQRLSDGMVRLKEAAREVGVSPGTFRTVVKSGKGPRAVQVSPGRVFFRRDDLAAWLDSRTTQGVGGVR